MRLNLAARYPRAAPGRTHQSKRHHPLRHGCQHPWQAQPAGIAGYIGNLWLRALAGSSVETLVEAATSQCAPATARQVAYAAQLIRKAIQTMDDPVILRQHLAIAARATDPRDPELTWPEVDAAVRRAISRHTTGLDASVAVSHSADIELDIPGTGGKMKAAWVRRAYVANDGAMNILVRKGATKGDADWEIWLALREEDIEAIAKASELGAHLSRLPA